MYTLHSWHDVRYYLWFSFVLFIVPLSHWGPLDGCVFTFWVQQLRWALFQENEKGCMRVWSGLKEEGIRPGQNHQLWLSGTVAWAHLCRCKFVAFPKKYRINCLSEFHRWLGGGFMISMNRVLLAFWWTAKENNCGGRQYSSHIHTIMGIAPHLLKALRWYCCI